MSKPQLILIGGGGHCKSCIDVIEMQDKFLIKGILDVPENIGGNVLGYPIIGGDSDLEKLTKSYSNFFISLGQISDCKKRKNIFRLLSSYRVSIPTIISPSAYVSKHSLIGEGTIIMHFAIVNAGAQIGDNGIINTRALIEHDASIGNHCHISTGAIVNGGVTIGDCSFFGSGAVSKEYIQLPENSFIKANSIAK
jgi:sugar O-acyltransferase (sialic acid O-acetyltransferase NeuD family)